MVSNQSVLVGQLSPQQVASIHLPASLFAILNDSTQVGVFYGIYENSTLFPVRETSASTSALRETQVHSVVLAATVGQNVTIQNLTDFVTVAFRLQNKNKNERVSL